MRSKRRCAALPQHAGVAGLGDPAAALGAVPPPAPEGRVLYDDLGIRIDRDGTWYYHGSPIQRKELVCLFASALIRDDAGQYWLVTPSEMGPVDVEDAPFVAVELFSAGRGQQQFLSFRTNVDEIVTVDQEHPLRVDTDPHTGEPAPYVTIRNGLYARLLRSVYYDVVALGVEAPIDGRSAIGVWSSGELYPLGWLDGAA